MEFSIKSGSPEKQRTGCVVVGVYEGRKLSASAQGIDAASGQYLSEVLRRGDLEGSLGKTLLLHHVPKLPADRVLLVGLGRERDFNEAAYRKACIVAARALRSTGTIDAVSYLTHLPVKGRDIAWSVREASLATQDEFYRFDAYRGEKARGELPASRLERVTFDVPSRTDLPAAEAALAEATAV